MLYMGAKEVVQTDKELLKWRVVLSALSLRLATTYKVHILESRRAQLLWGTCVAAVAGYCQEEG